MKKPLVILSLALLLAILLYFLFTTGQDSQTDTSTTLNGNEVTEITLQCTDACEQTMENPFDSQTFTDPDNLNRFIQAIEKAEGQMAEIDYSVEFNMSVLFADESTAEYYLLLQPVQGKQALLEEASSDSEFGYYEIQTEDADKLREIIYQ